MWDAVMQVGKTPLVTGNLTLPPYSSLGEEITGNALIDLISITGGIGVSGYLADLINVNSIDSVLDARGVVHSYSMSLTPADTGVFRVDLRRSLIMRGLMITFTYYSAGAVNMTLLVDVSNDDVTYKNIYSIGFGGLGGTADYSETLDNFEARYIRFRMIGNGTGGNGTIYFNKLRLFIDSTQYSY